MARVSGAVHRTVGYVGVEPRGESPVLKCRSDESAAWMVREAKPAGRLLQKHVLREKGRHANREEK